ARALADDLAGEPLPWNPELLTQRLPGAAWGESAWRQLYPATLATLKRLTGDCDAYGWLSLDAGRLGERLLGEEAPPWLGSHARGLAKGG
ncbi:MAG: hypothetical protein HUK26_08230, partial [Duodenibacillus sp.]|nr:hypothetical protein [Duodenibacillus sp.]